MPDQRRLADWVLVALTLGVQFWGLYAPTLPDLGTSGIPFADKAGHAVMFALATWALLRVLDVRIVLALMGLQLVASEVVQALFLPERSGDVWDAAADALGIAVGWWTWRKGLAEEDGNPGN
ncbi:VanZ family protein [Propioniciclava coleopterorum]|uniref:VanZ family protein n=1 Tax=Propioniciclava coleopterorum TaxID=2714937 RepID=A0A6G7Y9Y6_9ACTN|nr:VanZ family protein [Propioniciclava coleopterorum]QIK73615.1 VanZ family protein [Propioniciclava coleopterorum]